VGGDDQPLPGPSGAFSSRYFETSRVIVSALASRARECWPAAYRLSPMTRSVVGVHEAKTQLSRLLGRVEAGEEIDLARRGKVIATLVPVRRRAPRLGSMPEIVVADDFDAPLPPEIADALGA
jgi:antitoxin (DNA-binding transcriptional repressor) of toxin-antitoxin stability system